MKYDYLVVGAGLFGSVFAHEAHKAGKSVLMLEKRGHIGGNVYTEKIAGIDVHKYGAHIFHTKDREIWDYIRQFSDFNQYHHKVIANYKGELYDLPFNMYTFRQMWGVETPEEAKQIIEKQKQGAIEGNDLESKCISMVGTDIYNKLVKSYTEKQWGRYCKDLPSFIIERLPLRFEYNSDYFDDPYQGIPIGGYTPIIKKMLEGIEIRLNYDYLEHRDETDYDKLVFSGPIDSYYNYCFGHLEYRSIRFETEILGMKRYQNNAVINFTDEITPYTRIIEHAYFQQQEGRKTVISKEYPIEWKENEEPYYPINDERNNVLYQKYKDLANANPAVIFGGRLGEYRYYDMDRVIRSALDTWADIKKR